MICRKLSHYRWFVRHSCYSALRSPLRLCHTSSSPCWPELGHLYGVRFHSNPPCLVRTCQPFPWRRPSFTALPTADAAPTHLVCQPPAICGGRGPWMARYSEKLQHCILQIWGFFIRLAEVKLPRGQRALWWPCLERCRSDPTRDKLPLTCNGSYAPDFCKSGTVAGTFKFCFVLQWSELPKFRQILLIRRASRWAGHIPSLLLWTYGTKSAGQNWEKRAGRAVQTYVCRGFNLIKMYCFIYLSSLVI